MMLTPVVPDWSTVAELPLTVATELALGATVTVGVGAGDGVEVVEGEGLGLTETVTMLDFALAPTLSVALTKTV